MIAVMHIKCRLRFENGLFEWSHLEIGSWRAVILPCSLCQSAKPITVVLNRIMIIAFYCDYALSSVHNSS